MHLTGWKTATIGLVLIGALTWGCSADQSTPNSSSNFDQDYQQFNRLLADHVDKAGLVDYRGLQADSLLLDSVVTSFSMLPAVALEGFTDAQQLAFWINAYNAFLLHSVVASYPVGSIRDIPAERRQERLAIDGQMLTLRDIDQKVLRRQFTEPRAYFAIGTATRSGPALSRHAFQGATLEEQLETAAFRFLVDTTRNRFIPPMRRMELSNLFNEFGSDFVKPYWSDFPADQDELNRAVLNFISQMLPESLTGPIRQPGWTITYRPVDWALNDQARQQTSTAMTE